MIEVMPVDYHHQPTNSLEQALVNTGYVLYQWVSIDWEALKLPKEQRREIESIRKTWKVIGHVQALERMWVGASLRAIKASDHYSSGNYVPNVNEFGTANYSSFGRETWQYR